MIQKIGFWVLLALPAIPAVIVALSFGGFIDASPFGVYPDVYSGMNPIAAIGWGVGVYMIGLTLIGIGVILNDARKNKNC